MDLVGVIHLLPLPGAPAASPGLGEVQRRAVQDALALLEGGVCTAVIENLGDAPFDRGTVGPQVVAAMTAVGLAVQRETGGALGLGVNVLRNDARAALAVALALGARFVRVNVHTGAAWTDQGLIQGEAADTLRYRRALGLCPAGPAARGWLSDGGGGVRIAADVHVKHATPAGREDIGDAAADLALRGGADVVIVSGRHTGGETPLDDVARVRARLVGVPLWIGSGAQPERMARLAAVADGAIVGTFCHAGGRLDAPLDPARVAEVVAAAREASPARSSVAASDNPA